MFRLDLNGRWALAWCDRGEGEGQNWPAGGVPAGRRLEARVPGDVHLDLVEAGLLDEPLYGRHAPDCRWMEEVDWWYSRTIHVPPGGMGERTELVFAGLDTTADVWLNGTPVGQSNNAHVPQAFDVTRAVRPGENLLVVRLDAGIRAAQDKVDERYLLGTAADDVHRIWVRKPQFAFSWDWAPRLLTCGIWRDVELRSYSSAALRDVCLRSTILPDGSARVEVLADVESFCEKAMDMELDVSLRRGRAHAITLAESVPLGLHVLRGDLTVPDADLWWPAPLGEPALYDVAADLKAGGRHVDRRTLRCGIREVALLQEPIGEEGTSFVVTVNGEKVFCKGANWVPADSIIARVTPAKYRALIGAAAEANFNMLRIWGGGIYEDDLFYELCDEHGILVWQDFLFACAYYPDDDAGFMAEVAREAEKAVRRLRNHPCLVLWCGNNENQWIHYQRRQAGRGAERCIGEKIYDELLPEVCARLDPGRPYWPSSPYGGEDPNGEREGDRHQWDVSILAPTAAERIDYRRYGDDRGKFISEFGVMGPPHLDSARRCLPPGDMRLDSQSWAFHTNQFERGMIAEALERYWRPAAELSLDDYVRFGQMIQAEALKLALEHWRRRKFATAGALFWMYSDCWGEVGWTIIDYYLNRKAGYYAVKRAFAPVLVSLAQGEGGVEVWLVNDLREEVAGQLTSGWVDLRAGDVEAETAPMVAHANAVECVVRLDLPPGERERWMAFARFERDGEVLSFNRLFLTGFHFNRLALPEAHVTCDLAADRGELELRTDGFAWGVHLDAPRGVWLEDNDFDMLPGEARRIGVRGPAPLLERIAARPLNAGA